MNGQQHANTTTDDIARTFTALTRESRAGHVYEWMRARARVDLDRTAFVALDTLESDGPMRVSDLADACGVDISTMSRLVGRLGRDGLVDAGQLERDRRVVLVRITPAGADCARAIKLARRDALSLFLSDWTDAERVEFGRLLGRFVESMQRLAEREPVDLAGMEE